MKRKRFIGWRVIVSLVLTASLLFVTALVIVPLPLSKLNAPQAFRFYDRNDELLQVIISDDGFYRLSVTVDELPQLYIDTFLLQEDQFFYKHPGINPLAIARAAIANVSSGRVVSGASTITMQLARMLERRDRTVRAKILEMFRAIQIEMKFSKREILEYYLSIAPYGGNLEGVNAATYAYWGKPAKFLSPAQIALLVVLPKSPNGLRPDRFPLNALKKRNVLLEKMHATGLINSSTYSLAIDEPVPNQRLSFPTRIPHFAWYLKAQYPELTDFRTHLDLNVQIRAQRIVKQYITALYDKGIHNSSVVILDTQTRELRAMVGSADYFNQEHEGANNGAVALRSPGSTLKPFLYGLAMDNGLIAEKTMLPDIPITVAGYSPQNYSKTFRGQVQVREALVDSLNVVAVRLSQKMGIKKLYDLLANGGITSLTKSAEYYGLPLILGGVEVSLLELTNLYASLANYGEYEPYQLIKNTLPSKFNSASSSSKPLSIQLLSPEASWLVMDMMTDVERPDFPATWQYSKTLPTVAWKTGTSYGHQDAWSIGFHPEYTVGVWVGNFNGAPATQLSGGSAAGPLFFDLFQSIVNDPTKWFSKPVGIEQRSVCGLCGLPGNSYCTNTTQEMYIPSIDGPVTNETCQVMQRVKTNEGDSLIQVWPSELAAFYHRHGLPVSDVPAYEVNNMAAERYFPPIIQSPVEGTEYIRRSNHIADELQKIKLQAAVTNRIKKVQWFLDEKLIVESNTPYKPIFISPPVGEYKITLIDDTGGMDSVKLVVKDYRSVKATR